MAWLLTLPGRRPSTSQDVFVRMQSSGGTAVVEGTYWPSQPTGVITPDVGITSYVGQTMFGHAVKSAQPEFVAVEIINLPLLADGWIITPVNTTLYELRNFRPWQAEGHDFTYVTVDDSRSDSSTATSPVADALRSEAIEILNAARGEEFEFGSESILSTHITAFVRKYMAYGVELLGSELLSPIVDPNILGEALQTLGQIVDPKTYAQRLMILLRSLSNGRTAIRRGAIVGLAYLDDPSTIPALERALAQEKVGWVRNYFIAALRQLQQTKDGGASKNIQETK